MSHLINKDFGHIIVYGDTNSGKTYYTKYLIKDIRPKKTYVFAGVMDQWLDIKTAGLYDTFDNIKEIVEYCKENKNKVKRENKFIIVFDDFNKRINTQTNQDYLNLFTEGRHSGIRVINLAHHVQDIGPVVRNNARYIVFTKMPTDELKRIADLFYDGKYQEIVKAQHNTKQYTVCVLDKRNKELQTDLACNTSDSEVLHVKDLEVLQVEDSLYTSMPERAPLNISPIKHEIFTGNRGVNNTKNAGRDFLDNSNNIFNTAIKNEDKIMAVNNNHIINITKIRNEYECQRVKDSEETRYLIRKAWHTDAEIRKIIHTLNNELKPTRLFNINNYKDGCILFMHKFGECYTPPTGNDDLIDTVGTLYECRDNPINLLTIGYDKMIKWLR